MTIARVGQGQVGQGHIECCSLSDPQCQWTWLDHIDVTKVDGGSWGARAVGVVWEQNYNVRPYQVVTGPVREQLGWSCMNSGQMPVG